MSRRFKIHISYSGMADISTNLPIMKRSPRSKEARVTPARLGKGRKIQTPEETPEQTPAERRASMTWAQRLIRVFKIDIETCGECGGAVKIIASIEDPAVIRRILQHQDKIIPA